MYETKTVMKSVVMINYFNSADNAIKVEPIFICDHAYSTRISTLLNTCLEYGIHELLETMSSFGCYIPDQLRIYEKQKIDKSNLSIKFFTTQVPEYII